MSSALPNLGEIDTAPTPFPLPGARPTSRPPIEPVLRVTGLRVRFPHRDRILTAVDDLSYQLSPSGTLAIIGESGSGKTVSARALMGLLPHTASVEGSVMLSGRNLLTLSDAEMRRHRGSDVAMVFQDAARALNPTMRVGYQITEAIRAKHHNGADDAKRRAIELLDMLCVPAPRQRFLCYPHELSGGLRQRVLIAIALSGNPRVLIADEATRSLDAIIQAETLRLLKSLQRQIGMALVMISHDLRLASSFADHVLVMYAGRSVEYAATDDLFRNPRMRYTKALLDAMPRSHLPPHTPFPIVPGQPPDLSALPRGCAFQHRCAWTEDDCRQQRPLFEEHLPGHSWACLHPCADAESL